MKLLIGNKNYSSWSFRVWLTMKVKEIEFEEDLRPFDVENDYADFFEFSPTGKVPVLQHDGLTVVESLAILEYLAEQFPDKNLWPANPRSRSDARCISHEMHAGFMALRAACPMNMRRKHAAIAVDEAVLKDVRRIETIWSQCLDKSGGPFLFGDYSIADGMYAPIVNRLQIYELSNIDAVASYTQTMTSLTPWQDWDKAARDEPWVIDIDEV
ncbi:glutathione S-transferase family protein [Parasphingorhabdus halotolerans]|uniref:Glutathione S-transferase family protein n=1 Tax=Parasphingorhabdus halotolerans TaxID=2725558 RepID=A0A6H2DP53_9SPHN|nr:glutathione S-transferase family protein [Parasphingorhabdus halotolerans]QJB69917.1 glutathione S-transferase family protein [Parasphingorhabdus halotolerans]